MQNRIKPSCPVVPPPQAKEGVHDIGRLVEEILGVLTRNSAEPTEGVLSLLTAFMQASHNLMEASTPEEAEHNRAALTAMLEHGKRFVDTWPDRTPARWTVH